MNWSFSIVLWYHQLIAFVKRLYGVSTKWFQLASRMPPAPHYRAVPSGWRREVVLSLRPGRAESRKGCRPACALLSGAHGERNTLQRRTKAQVGAVAANEPRRTGGRGVIP